MPNLNSQSLPSLTVDPKRVPGNLLSSPSVSISRACQYIWRLALPQRQAKQQNKLNVPHNMSPPDRGPAIHRLLRMRLDLPAPLVPIF
jgi:hypothetical protein